MKSVTTAVIVGMKGTGKSTLLRGMARKATRLFVLDTMREHGGEVEHVYTDAHALSAFFQTNARGPWRVAFQPDLRSQTQFDAACGVVWELGNCLLIIDEVDLWTAAGQMPDSLYQILMLGRHRGINMVCTCRRPANMPLSWRSQADTWAVFRVLCGADIDALEAASVPCVRRVAELPRFQFLWRRHEEDVTAIGEIQPDGSVRLIKRLAATMARAAREEA